MLTVAASDDSEDDDSSAAIDYHEPDEGNIEVDPVFQEDYDFPGTVKIIVGETHFWCVQYVNPLKSLDIYRLIKSVWFSLSAFVGLIRKCCILLRRSSKQLLVAGEHHPNCLDLILGSGTEGTLDGSKQSDQHQSHPPQ